MAGRRRLAEVAGFVRDPRVAAVAVAAAAGVLVFAVATELFPYHSVNHDEGVYLHQASMLLEGQVTLAPEAPVEAFRPWFFVREGGTLYPKYTPVAAAMFAVGEALADEPRVALAAVAAGNAGLTYALVAAAFDRRVGVLAAVALVGSPLFLFSSSVFLSYAPTTFWNLAFAVAYVRAARRASPVWGGVAGLAAGVAFFSRPYTAVLFAAPFLIHAGYQFVAGMARRRREPVVRHAATAVTGLAGVGVALAYNAAVTGSPLLFPYEAFAPLDGLGFGRRRLLDHELRYTPGLALRANAHAVWYLLTRWTVAGPVGAALAGVGLAGLARSVARSRSVGAAPTGMSRRALRVALAGVLASVVAGNVYFWGNRNVLAEMGDPTTGFVAVLGPYYHFDALVPLSAFAASGAVLVAARARSLARARLEPRHARAALLVALVIAVPVVGAAEAAVVEPPWERNAAHTEKFERAYAPFEERGPEDALVYIPAPYGQWQNHPFQALRNDPGIEGDVVYALDGSPDRDFAVLDAVGDRTLYRYTYRGEWTPDADDQVTPKLVELDAPTADSFVATTTVGVPASVTATGGQVRLTNGERTARYAVDASGEEIGIEWSIAPGGVRAAGDTIDQTGGPERVPIEGADELALTVTLADATGATITYRQELTVRPHSDGVQVLWPPETSVCRLVTDCGREGTHLPDHPDAHLPGVSVDASLQAVEDANASRAG